MKIVEWIKLKHRANKYKNKDDRGGIAYIHQAIELNDIVFDIGTHKAGYMYFMQTLVGTQGKVYGFEPQSTLFEYVKRMKKLFNWKNVSITHLALSNGPGMATLFIPTNHVRKTSSPGATIYEQKGESDSGKTEQVQTKSLDDYCREFNVKPDFLKIDVEGNELAIFQGGIETLKSCKPKMIVEIESRHVGEERVMLTLAFLKNLGYSARFIHGTEYVPIENFTFARFQNQNYPADYCNNFIFE